MHETKPTTPTKASNNAMNYASNDIQTMNPESNAEDPTSGVNRGGLPGRADEPRPVGGAPRRGQVTKRANDVKAARRYRNKKKLEHIALQNEIKSLKEQLQAQKGRDDGPRVADAEARAAAAEKALDDVRRGTIRLLSVIQSALDGIKDLAQDKLTFAGSIDGLDSLTNDLNESMVDVLQWNPTTCGYLQE